MSQAGAYLVNGFLKVFACVYRPWILDSRVHPVKEAITTATGYSFPSGHTTSATTFFAGTVLRGRLSKGLNIVLIICLLLVGFSRNYLGVHSILDVIFAIIFTLMVLFVFSKLFDKLETNPNLDIIISVVGIIISILVVIYSLTKSYPLDYDAAGKLIVDPAILTIDTFKSAGFAVGIFFSWPIERRFIKFLTDGTVETKVLRFICGFIALEFIINVILPIIGETPIGGFLQYFLIMVFVMLIYPIIFKFFENRANKV
ncbi:phosphatase PAP2 family protein [uncultured Methanobrevibacter sp.]|uniref:phosphatase PAP2 family protein n=1 Tax=uncultured Methanobrevibacter sp. TaxID=253161 RepID=UPI0025D8CBD8|nr:phosphatase PAP2 family protein [uncultured Methanobrevibacter sp.]